MIRKATTLILFLMQSLLSFGQSEQTVLPTERKEFTIITEPYTLYKGFFRAGMALQYSSIYKIFNENGERVPISNSSGRTWSSLLILQYGVTDRLQLNVDLPYTQQDLFLSYQGELPGAAVFEQQKLEGKGKGIGDLSIGLGYQLFTENESRPSLKISPTLVIPTGQENPVDTGDPNIIDIPVGNGYYAIDLALSMRKVNYPFSYSFYVDYKIKFAGEKIFDLGGPVQEFKDGNLLTLSGSYNFHMNEWLALTNDLYYYHSGEYTVEGNTISEKSWLIEYAPRLSFQIKHLRVNQSIQIPLVGKMSGADPGFILVVQYVF